MKLNHDFEFVKNSVVLKPHTKQIIRSGVKTVRILLVIVHYCKLHFFCPSVVFMPVASYSNGIVDLCNFSRGTS